MPEQYENMRRSRSVFGAGRAIAVLGLAALASLAPCAHAQPVPPWLVFTGPGTGWVEVPDSLALSPTSAITVEAWVYLSDSSGYGGECPTLVGKDYNRSYWLGLACGSTQLRFYTHGSSSNIDSTGSVPTGTWSHVAVTYDGATTTFYIDGHLDSSFTATAAPVGVSSAPLRIGDDVSWDISPKGEIDQVRLWSVARSQCDIIATKDTEISSPMAGLVAVWNLDGNANDALGAHNGTIMHAVGFRTFPEPWCANAYFVPTAGNLPGEAGTHWVTDLSALLVGSSTGSLQLTLLPRDQDNSNPVSIHYFNASPVTSMAFPDIVQASFGHTNMAAAIRVCSDQPLLVASRTYNQGSAGTYGQGVPGFPASRAIKPGQKAYLTALYENTGFRTNVGFVNSSLATVTVTVDFYMADGTSIGTREYTLPPLGYIQRGHIFHEVTGDDVTNGTIRIQVSCGGVFAYAAVIDDATGDPTYFEAE